MVRNNLLPYNYVKFRVVIQEEPVKRARVSFIRLEAMVVTVID